MDRAPNSFVNNYKILLFIVVVVISLFLKFVPYFITVTILLVLFGVLVYFDSSCASDVSALIVSWFYLLYSQISNSFLNVTAQPKRVIHPNAPVTFKPPFQLNQMNYIKMKNEMPSPIPRELNLNPSVRLRSRNGPPPVAPDYCINFRDDKQAGPSFTPPRINKVSKNAILTDITSSYATHQRYPSPVQYRNGTRRDYHLPSPGSIPLSNNCSPLYDNISSPGFSGRIAQCVSEQNSMNHSKYQNIGDFPLVHFNQQEPKKKLTPSNSQTTAKQRVTVRIAPPANRSLKKVYNVEQEEKMKSVLEVLKEMSRKRMYSSVDAEEAENCKRLRTHSQPEIPVSRRLPISPKNMIPMDITPLGKRIRDTSSDSIDEEVKKRRRQASSISNEIKSSLSSSLTITPPHLSKSNSVKRKATNEISSADKHFKSSSVLDQSNESSSEKSSSSSREASLENESYKDDSSAASTSSSKMTNENDEVEITQEISLDKTSGSNLIIKKTKKVPEDSVDSNTSLLHDETSVLRLKPVRNPVPIVATPEHKPKKDILRLPKDWEANPRSLQKTPKNPGKMLKKVLCAIEGTEDINFDSLPDYVKKMIASVDEIDGPSVSSKKTVPETRTESGIQQQQPITLSSSNTNKASTSTTSTFSAPAVSSTFNFTGSSAKTSSPFSFSATSQLPNPLLASQR